MVLDTNRIERLIAELEAIRLSAFLLESEFDAELAKVAETSRDGSRNLLHYLALRRRDLRPLQEELAVLGLSSLGRAEAHAMGTIESVLTILYRLVGKEFDPKADGMRAVGFLDGKRRLEAHADSLFGTAKTLPIMVTMPREAATTYEVVRDLVAGGMTCMRINCAHDDRNAWEGMIHHLRRAREETGRECRLFMDLAGPKIRTGEMEPGSRIIRWEPKRDELGRIVAPASIWLTPAETPELPPRGTTRTLPIAGDQLARLEPGCRLRFKDLRGRSRSLRIVERVGNSLMAESNQITYIGAESILFPHPKGAKKEESPPGFRADGIQPHSQYLRLGAGDTLVLTKDQTPGKPVVRDATGQLVEEPRIGCTLPEIFQTVKEGERVRFDDGKLGGVVTSVTPDTLRIRITEPISGSRKKLRASKGVNFPDTELRIPALTKKDLEDIQFIVQYADIVGFSFVNRIEDVEHLQREIYRAASRPIGMVLKIETRRAFESLPRLLLAALRSDPVGVMIARGDLAVECGFERMAELQEEILWVCEAAHVPVIWATQVLETLNKKGMPSRAEITDAAMAERAECVMLNKGPHILETVRVLDNVIGRMRSHQDKKSPTLRALKISRLDS